MMKPSTAKKVLSTLVAAVTLTMVTSIAPATAAAADGDRSTKTTARDTGWDKP